MGAAPPAVGRAAGGPRDVRRRSAGPGTTAPLTPQTSEGGFEMGRPDAGLATPLAEGDCGVVATLVRVLDDVADVGDPQTKGGTRCQPKQSARSRTPRAASGRTTTGGPIS